MADTEGLKVINLSEANASWNKLALEISRERLSITIPPRDTPKSDQSGAGTQSNNHK
jgi:hypothetical protein